MIPTALEKSKNLDLLLGLLGISRGKKDIFSQAIPEMLLALVFWCSSNVVFNVVLSLLKIKYACVCIRICIKATGLQN